MNPPYRLTDTAFLRDAQTPATRWQIGGVNGGPTGGAIVSVIVTNYGDVTTQFAFQTAPQPSDSPALDNLLVLAIPGSGSDPGAIVGTETLGTFNGTFTTVTAFKNVVNHASGTITLTPGARVIATFRADAFVQVVPVSPTSIPASKGPGQLRLTAICNLPIACVSHDTQRPTISIR